MNQPDEQPTSLHDLGKHLELSGCIERHEIHTTISAEIASIEPVPVLKIRRRWLQAACYQHPAGMGQVWLCGGAGLARPSLGQHGANSPQTCARAPSRTENSYGYQLSCGIFLKHKQGFTLWTVQHPRLTLHTLGEIRSVEKGLSIRSYPGRLLTQTNSKQGK